MSDLYVVHRDPTLAVRADRVRDLGRVLPVDSCWEPGMDAAGAWRAPDRRSVEYLLGVWFCVEALDQQLQDVLGLDEPTRRQAQAIIGLIRMDQTVHAPARRALFDELVATYITEDLAGDCRTAAQAGRALARLASATHPLLPNLVELTFPHMATAFLATPHVGIRWELLDPDLARHIKNRIDDPPGHRASVPDPGHLGR
jgi:hypothetical protein